MAVAKIVYAVYADEDSSYVKTVLDAIRRQGVNVCDNPKEVTEWDSIHLFFLSKAFINTAGKMEYLKRVVSAADQFPFAVIRLDNTSADPNTELFLRRYQYLFAEDFASAAALGKIAGEALAGKKDENIPQYEGLGKFLFISYSHAESELISAVAEELKNRKLNLWYDRSLVLGDVWASEISEHIQASRAFLAFVSKRFAESGNCKAEVDLAASPEVKTLVTIVRMKGATLDQGIEMYIRSGATILLRENYKNISDLVDAILRSNGIRDCGSFGFKPAEKQGWPFAGIFRQEKKPQEDPNIILTVSLYPQNLKTETKKIQTSSRSLKQMTQETTYIRDCIDRIRTYRDDEVRGMTERIRQRLADQEPMESIVPDAFAAAAEAYNRIWGSFVMPTAILSGLAMYYGYIAETPEPEFRIQSLFFAAYALSLEGKRVHIVTARDTETRKLSEELKPLCEYLGVSLGIVYNNTAASDRRSQYTCDITIVTYAEIGFDYLKDCHMTADMSRKRLGSLDCALLSDADEFFLGIGKKDIILTNSVDAKTNIYYLCERLARQLRKGNDYTLDGQYVRLTHTGIEKTKAYFRIDNSADEGILILQNRVLSAIKAHELYIRGRDYLVEDDRIIAINQETGLREEFSSFSNGIRHALEAKERLAVTKDNTETAKINTRNLFRQYAFIAGISRAEIETPDYLKEALKLEMIRIPLNRPLQRTDLPERLYATQGAKVRAMARDAADAAEQGKAIVIGATGQGDFALLKEELLRQAKEKKIRTNILSPGMEYEQAMEILKLIGRSGQITLVTGYYIKDIDYIYDKDCAGYGGMLFMASSYFANSVMDEQFRSAAGKWDIPGETVTYLSMDDPMIRRAVAEEKTQFLSELAGDDPIESKLVIKGIHSLRKKILQAEKDNSRIMDAYNNIFENQRKQFVSDRERILRKENLDQLTEEIIRVYVQDIVNDGVVSMPENQKELDGLLDELFPYLTVGIRYTDLSAKEYKEQLRKTVLTAMQTAVDEKEQQFDSTLEDIGNHMKTVMLLKAMDEKWPSHIAVLYKLRDRESTYAEMEAYLPEYKRAAGNMYVEMVKQIRELFIRMYLNVRPQRKTENPENPEPKKKPVRKVSKIYPNDPCPCGSGKKYKHCHGRQE